jgi:uncharacterized protein (TIGR02301 family)
MMRGALIFVTIAVGLTALPARALEAPFETRLLRLSEVLGSLHYLRNLCGDRTNQWRDEMEALLAAESPEPAMRARYISSFNSGYRSFGAAYTTCTQSARVAAERYRVEGATLSREIALRYGN